MSISVRPRRILVLADQASTSHSLAAEVRRRHDADVRVEFTLLVPVRADDVHGVVGPGMPPRVEAQGRIEDALPFLSHATGGGPVVGMIGRHEPLAAVRDAIDRHGFDEVIVSLPPSRWSDRVRGDLPRKVAAWGVPVATVNAPEAARAALAA